MRLSQKGRRHGFRGRYGPTDNTEGIATNSAHRFHHGERHREKEHHLHQYELQGQKTSSWSYWILAGKCDFRGNLVSWRNIKWFGQVQILEAGCWRETWLQREQEKAPPVYLFLWTRMMENTQRAVRLMHLEDNSRICSSVHWLWGRLAARQQGFSACWTLPNTVEKSSYLFFFFFSSKVFSFQTVVTCWWHSSDCWSVHSPICAAALQGERKAILIPVLQLSTSLSPELLLPVSVMDHTVIASILCSSLLSQNHRMVWLGRDL